MDPVPAATSRATSPGSMASWAIIRDRHRPSWPMLKIPAQRSYPGASGAKRSRAMRVGESVTDGTVPDASWCNRPDLAPTVVSLVDRSGNRLSDQEVRSCKPSIR